MFLKKVTIHNINKVQKSKTTHTSNSLPEVLPDLLFSFGSGKGAGDWTQGFVQRYSAVYTVPLNCAPELQVHFYFLKLCYNKSLSSDFLNEELFIKPAL